jgi:ubiquinone/menaquinone biosynthesis C-methylase UbiE
VKAPFAGTLQRIASIPWAYDRIQALAGSARVRRFLASQVAPLGEARVALDLGGGTGLYRDIWPTTCSYICLDVDPLKLRAVSSRRATGSPLLADAAHIPLQDNSAGVILCVAMAHHLPEALLESLLRESARVLDSAGTFVFLDAVLQPRRWLGRLLWRYDRGSYPRCASDLSRAISGHFRITNAQSLSVFHEYFFCTGSARPMGQPTMGVQAWLRTIQPSTMPCP